ncbi:MAG: winged helix-turn-helix transcriptional regulator [Candidatus Brocadiae bacterium]|nr:winged helix-turn-helix transcriptional regulator [Candidatus Brocadiia bacterium]
MIEQTFRALSDRTRLRILHFLRGGELCVGDLVQLLAVPQPAASRHLATLRKTGLVTVRRDGLWCFYSLAIPPSPFHRRLRDSLHAGLDADPELKEDSRRAAGRRGAGGCCPGQSRRASGAAQARATVPGERRRE